MARYLSTIVAVAVMAGLQTLIAVPAQAAPGDLDTSFGGTGKVTTDFPPPGGLDQGSSVAIQSDGKIVVAGWTEQAGTRDFALARYNPDGTLDTGVGGFGGGTGLVFTDFFGEADEATAVAIDSVGRIVVAGVATEAGNRDFAVARYTSGGVLDTAGFNPGVGWVTTDFGGDDQANAVAIRAGDEIVAAGAGGFISDFALAGYNSDGSLDGGFGTGGLVTTDFGAGEVDEAAAIAIDSAGRIVAAGRTDEAGNRNFALARYTSGGTLDMPAFGGDGLVTTDFEGGLDQAFGVAVQSDGKIVAAGVATTALGGLDFGLARYTSGGVLDTAGFNPGVGRVTTDFDGGDDVARDVVIQPNGKIVAAGLATVGGDSDFGLARYTTAGALDDSGFSPPDGLVNTDFDIAGGADQAYGVAIQPADGKIVAAGAATVGVAADQDFAVARYDGDPLVPPAPSADLSISKTDSPDPVVVNGVLTYTLMVSNAGPQSATGVVVSDMLPPSVSVLSATASQGTCTLGATTTCTLGTVLSGGVATVTIVVQPHTAVSITNTATVASPVADPVAGNNTATVTTTVSSGPGCTITGTAGNDTLVGTPGNDVICGLGGNDSISAGGGNDTIQGGSGNDRMFGGTGDDTIIGGTGSDEASGAAGNDTLNSVDGVSGNDTNSGGSGNDTCIIDPGDPTSC